MTGAVIEINQVELAHFQKVLDQIMDRATPHALLEQLTGGVESQTRRRIADEKTSPDGAPWPQWSPAYAGTRHAGQSLLQGHGDLLDSITGEVRGDQGEIGTNLVYGATQQFGDDRRGIPARPYLGLSHRNMRDLERLTEHWAEGLLS